MTWRKIHFWISLVVAVQFALWIISGVAFCLFPPDELRAEADSRRIKPGPIAGGDMKLTAENIAEIFERQTGRNPDIGRIVLQTRLPDARTVFVVRDRQAPAPVVIDARTGEVLPPLTESQAVQIARSDFTGRGDVSKVEPLEDNYRSEHAHGREPSKAYVIHFSDWKRTEIHVSAYTGQIMTRQNLYRSVHDVFWSIHVFGYLDDGIQSNIPILFFGAISLFMAISGAVLYLPFFRRRREALSGVPELAPIRAEAAKKK